MVVLFEVISYIGLPIPLANSCKIVGEPSFLIKNFFSETSAKIAPEADVTLM